ncbi:acyltransferase family protein [Pseudarthrobacter sp. PS3-L1]|uniref:acyltransferase family protein n=1 Tax=Pseudarthrobacter sp. PS3-L1 TaxID=3046207 RepID=UPI0024B9B4F1|nr:acyltransferase family protein [Pseudarthrobacter sp. PS3-L1]MDJ0321339.1 acyltransferase family protein [Pseudarthrobacter sp. PS3-L1]
MNINAVTRNANVARGGFRPELQGLRALAVLLVVSYHVWLGRVSGGVDVFLLISAFLMTLSFVRRVNSGGSLNLFRHWLHVFKRLLPAAVVVILSVLAGTAVVLQPSRWQAILDQAWATLFYVQNWLLAATAVDYYAQDHARASPLQHFWSLSIQGQVFILWPIIFVAAAYALKALRKRNWVPEQFGYSGLLAVIFGSIFASSLAFSIQQTSTNQSFAYFDTRTRLWEFALGTLLALAVPHLNPGKAVRVFLGWIGLAAIVSCGLVLSVDSAFPGFIALWPTLAAAAVIIAGQSGSRVGVDRLLTWKPLMRLGDVSYALYLWHWPILVLWLAWTGLRSPTLVQGLFLVGIALSLSFLTVRFIEKPLGAWHWPQQRTRRSAVVVLACGALLAGPVAVWQSSLVAEERAVAAQPSDLIPGAAAIGPNSTAIEVPEARLVPAPAALENEWFFLDQQCSDEAVPVDDLLKDCRQTSQAEHVAKRIVVLGDSHAQQFMAALEPIAQERGWEVISLLRGSCRFGAQSESRDQDCNAFNRASSNYVLDQRPDAVFTVATMTHAEEPYETAVDGYLEGVRPFSDAGIDVVGIRDNPRFDFSMAECVLDQGPEAEACNPSIEESLAAVSPLEEFHDTLENLSLMDMSDFFCAEGVCPAVVGNIFVYKDDSHLTKSYVESMVPMFRERLLAATGWQ